ncbi:hypothetical protein pipiens_002040 [Culex pipiens pipiens]|uniref:Uncharacterized protein n=1 Tax=Culex pipiens pipiens TaxID=38569 RepID=A0ABD1DM79_CULPP
MKFIIAVLALALSVAVNGSHHFQVWCPICGFYSGRLQLVWPAYGGLYGKSAVVGGYAGYPSTYGSWPVYGKTWGYQAAPVVTKVVDNGVVELWWLRIQQVLAMEPVYLHQNGHRAAVRFPACNYSVSASLRRDAGIAESAGAKLLANRLHRQTVDPLRPASLQLTPPPLRRQPTPFNPLQKCPPRRGDNSWWCVRNI